MQGSDFLADPKDLGIDPGKLDALIERAGKEVDAGLLPSVQIALARNGKLALFATWGKASNDSLYCIFSATKAITSAAAWLLVQEGKLDIGKKVSDLIPEFARNGKENISIEQLFLHTAGFPHAPFRVEDWADKTRRLQRFGDWRLDWEPGSRYEYHPTSSMWVIGEIIERLSGLPFDAFIRERLALPLGLADLHVGAPEAQHHRIAAISHVGEPLTPEDYRALGLPVPPETEVTPAAIEKFNTTINRITPMPGGGGITSAADLALFYQALIGKGVEPVWREETLQMATRPRTGDLIDPMTNWPVNRALGVVISGDEKRNYRGFGHTNSPLAFGHGGAGGQVGWVDPDTGISFACLTNGHDRNPIRAQRRGVSLSNRAAVCAV